MECLPDRHRSTDLDARKQTWYRLKLKRSRWYDLFSPDERLELMRGIWAVFGYLMRKGPESEEDASTAKDRSTSENLR